jgi:hypothetical protein
MQAPPPEEWDGIHTMTTKWNGLFHSVINLSM